MSKRYTNLKVYIEEVTSHSVCIAVGEWFLQMRSVWIPRGLIRDGWDVDLGDSVLDVETWFVKRYRLTDA